MSALPAISVPCGFRPASLPASSRFVQEALRLAFAPAAEATPLLLIREAQPCIKAHSPSGLSARGRDQARALASRLTCERIAGVYSASPVYAEETASEVAATQSLCVIQVADLDGVRSSDRDAPVACRPVSAQRLAERLSADLKWDSLPGSEGSASFRGRVIETIEAIVARHPGARVAVVCSAETINAYVTMVLGVQRDLVFLPGHASITTLHLSGELYAVQRLNDNAHLAPALQSY